MQFILVHVPLQAVADADLERGHGAYPHEAVDEDAEVCAVTEREWGRDIDAVDEGQGLIRGEDRSLAGLVDTLIGERSSRC